MTHMNIDELPIGAAIEILHIDDTGSYIARLIKDSTSNGVESPTVPWSAQI